MTVKNIYKIKKIYKKHKFVNRCSSILKSFCSHQNYMSDLLKKAKFWWHKFHKSLNKISQNYKDIFVKIT